MARITIASLQSTIEQLRADMERITAQQSAIIKAQAATISELEAKLAAPTPAPTKPADNVPPWVDDAPTDEVYTVTRERRPVATPTSPAPVGRAYTRRDGATYQKFQVGFNRFVERRV